jgi:hypothetical protein
LKLTGLIDKVIKVIKAVSIEDRNKFATPAETTQVGADIDGLPFDEAWEYASIVGMLMYLVLNTRQGIAYDVHQAAR